MSVYDDIADHLKGMAATMRDLAADVRMIREHLCKEPGPVEKSWLVCDEIGCIRAPTYRVDGQAWCSLHGPSGSTSR